MSDFFLNLDGAKDQPKKSLKPKKVYHTPRPNCPKELYDTSRQREREKSDGVSSKKQALAAWLDQLQTLVEWIAPVPAAAHGVDPLEADFRHLAPLELPSQEMIDTALSFFDGGKDAEELARRASQLESDYNDFCAQKRRWEIEATYPILAMTGKLGKLSNPVEALRKLRRDLCGDIAYLQELIGTKEAAGYNGGMSQSEFAKEIGVSKRTIQNWEAGKTTPPKIYHPTDKKLISYSADLRKDPTAARFFAMEYKLERKAKRGIRQPVEYRG